MRMLRIFLNPANQGRSTVGRQKSGMACGFGTHSTAWL